MSAARPRGSLRALQCWLGAVGLVLCLWLGAARAAAPGPAPQDLLLAEQAAEQARAALDTAARELAVAAGDARRQAAGRQADVALVLRMANTEAAQASVLIDLSDLEARAGRPQQALAVAEAGLALLGDQAATPMRRALLHNAVLARVAPGRTGDLRRDIDALQATWGETDVSGQQLMRLRELGDALAARGDYAGALDMHHREQALSQRLDSANREAALAEVRVRYDREAEGQRIELLARSNRLASTALANQRLSQRLWATAGGLLLLGCVLLLMLLRRVRQTGRLLADNRASLKVQSEHDALTGASSRRHAQTVLAEAGAQRRFSGALLMIDLDHFKQINDGLGHAAGDRVLTEVARRIIGAVRPHDLVARWGGEEFLVFAADMQRDEADALAARLLQAVAGQPVTWSTTGQPPLRVTASIGHAVFPLAPHGVALGVEQAINLVDMALYSAKGQGRHRAVGIVGCDAANPATLRDVEADFERAWQDGRLRLRTDLGPGPVLDHAPAGAHWEPIEPAPSETHP